MKTPIVMLHIAVNSGVRAMFLAPDFLCKLMAYRGILDGKYRVLKFAISQEHTSLRFGMLGIHLLSATSSLG